MSCLASAIVTVIPTHNDRTLQKRSEAKRTDRKPRRHTQKRDAQLPLIAQTAIRQHANEVARMPAVPA